MFVMGTQLQQFVNTLVDDLLRQLTEEARFAWEDAMRFESRVVTSALYFKGIAKLGNMGGGPLDLGELYEWEGLSQLEFHLDPHDHHKPAMTLSMATDYLAKNLSDEFPDLREKLQKGEKVRNFVVHRVGLSLGNVEYLVVTKPIVACMSGKLPWDELPSVMSEQAASFIGEMDRVRKEMAKHRQFADLVHDAAYRKFMVMQSDMDSRLRGSAEFRPFPRK